MNLENLNSGLNKRFEKILGETKISGMQIFLMSDSRVSRTVDETNRKLAVSLWRFIKENSYEFDEETRKEFLNQFNVVGKTVVLGKVGHLHRYLYYVSLVESLPTLIWRKFLWKYNCDFSSLDCFLRRLTPEQVEMLELTCKDISSGKFPAFLSEKEINSLKEMNYSEKFSSEERYESKCAWSYNLFGLDFGFNAYPNGENDDTKNEAISAWRFLSIKHPADNFVVDEGGKYYHYYKLVRSNYVWHPKRKVELKKHICPGFWVTFLMLIWFFIISPIASVVFPLALSHEPSLFQKIILYSSGALAWLTPLWLVLALIKKTFLSLARGKIGNAVVEMSEHLFKSFGENSEKFNVSISSMAFILIAYGLNSILYLFPSVLISLLFVLWVGYYLYNKEVNGWFKGYPDRLRQFWNSLFVLTALVMIKDYPEEFMTLVYFLSSIPGFILNLFLIFLPKLWNLILEYYSFILVIVPTFIFLTLLIKLDKLEGKEEYSKLGKISSFLEKSSSLLLGFFFVIITFSWGMIFKQGIIQINLLALVLIILSFIFPFVLFLIPIKEKTKIYVLDTEFIKIIRKTLEELRNHSFWIPDSKMNFLVEQVLFNKFFTKENFREKCWDLFDLGLSRFPEKNKVYLLGKVLGEDDKKTVPSLKELFKGEKYQESNDWEKWDLIFDLVVLKMSFKEAFKEIEESKKTKEVKEKKSEKFVNNFLFGLKIVFFPIVLLWKIGVSLAVIKKIWDKFNEICPYIHQPKTLS